MSIGTVRLVSCHSNKRETYVKEQQLKHMLLNLGLNGFAQSLFTSEKIDVGPLSRFFLDNVGVCLTTKDCCNCLIVSVRAVMAFCCCKHICCVEISCC